MSDHKIQDLSSSIAKAAELAHQLSRKADPGWKEKDAKVNFQRLADGLGLMKDALNYLEREFDIERNKNLLSSAALSSTEETLAEFGTVSRQAEGAVENAGDDNGAVENNDLQESEADTLLTQLEGVGSKVLLLSKVIFYAAQIRRGDSKSVRQRQEGEIRALLDGETMTNEELEVSTGGNTATVLQADATDKQSSDFAQDTSSPGLPTNSMSGVPETRKESSPIIVGIDFGATSSAAAFALANSNKQELKVLGRWPEAVRFSIDRLPREQQQIQSTVYYSSIGKVIGWGEDKHEAVTPRPSYLLYGDQQRLLPVCSLRPGVHLSRDFKFGLSPPGDINWYIPIPRGQSAADVAADYLWHLRHSACSQVEDQLGAGSGKAQGSLRYVMTVPASWDEKARERLCKVAKRAGFWIKSDEELALIPGPEAAMLYADSIDSSAFNIGDNILVVDCGGNLVESVTYEVKSKDPIRLEKCTSVSVASCGSAEVTRHYMRIVESKTKKLGLSDINMSKLRLRAKCRSQFEGHIKLEFGRPDFQPPQGIPRGLWAVLTGWESDFPEADLEDGYMMFSAEEIYSCFNPVVDRTLELIENQITSVRAQNKGLQACLLVGGFNKCTYYSQQVQSRIAAHGLKIIQPDLSLAFVKGAVLAGLRDVQEVGQLEGDVEGRKVRNLVMKWTTLSQEQMSAL